MNEQRVIEINKEFVKLVAENPELPIKVFINGECSDGDGWFVGEIYDCKVTRIVEYEDRCYERRLRLVERDNFERGLRRS